MSDDTSQQGDEKHHHVHHHLHHDHGHSSRNDKKVIHHNHYKHGSIVSSYTAVDGRAHLPPRTTPFKPCHPHPHARDKKRIELVIKQGGGLGYVTREHDPATQIQIQRQPQQAAVTVVSPPPGTCAAPAVQYYPQKQYAPLEPIYEPAPPARQYEYYQGTRVDDRRYYETQRRNIDRDPRRYPEVVSEGTGTSTTKVDAKKHTAMAAGPSRVTFQDQTRAQQTTEGTGTSMVFNPAPLTGPQRLLIIKRDENHLGPSYDSAPITPLGMSEATVAKSETDVREGDLCPLCHKGWYVKKFTWSGIIAAIFCFPCGIFFCFRMRVYVCSFCGEQPVAEYNNYKETEVEKTDGTEESRSRLIPPQKSSNWKRQQDPEDVTDNEGNHEERNKRRDDSSNEQKT